MSRLSAFLFGMVAGAVLLYVAMNFHVMRTGEGFHLITKQPARLSEAYVDVRAFTMADWASHPQLAAALVQADKQYLLGEVATGAFQDNLKQLLPEWPKR